GSPGGSVSVAGAGSRSAETCRAGGEGVFSAAAQLRDATDSTQVWIRAVNWEAVITSLELASVTSVLLILIALPLSYWVAFSRWRWKFLVEAIVALPLVLPPTVLGF